MTILIAVELALVAACLLGAVYILGIVSKSLNDLTTATTAHTKTLNIVAEWAGLLPPTELTEKPK